MNKQTARRPARGPTDGVKSFATRTLLANDPVWLDNWHALPEQPRRDLVTENHGTCAVPCRRRVNDGPVHRNDVRPVDERPRHHVACHRIRRQNHSSGAPHRRDRPDDDAGVGSLGRKAQASNPQHGNHQYALDHRYFPLCGRCCGTGGPTCNMAGRLPLFLPQDKCSPHAKTRQGLLSLY